MKRFFAIFGISQVLLLGALAQTPDDLNEGSRLEYDSVNSIMRFKWWGRSGRTYFIQHADNLMNPWQWVPAVESGNDSIKEWGFTTTGDKFFVRLKYSDQATTDPEGDDFDLDGVPNLYEVQHGNNPFAIEDSDNDGLPDGWLDAHAGTFAIYPPSHLTASLSRNQMAPGKIYLNNDTATAVNYSVAVSANTGPSYAVSPNAAYQWEEISTTGTKLNAISNAWSGYESVNIGFAFPFYGQTYTNVSVDVNGLLVFTSPGYYDYNAPIPYYSTYTPAAMIAPLWEDLETSTAGDIFYKAEADRLIVQYEAVKPNNQTGSYTFQVVLNSDGTIQFRYKTLSGLTNFYTVGIQDGTRTQGLQLAYNTAYLSDGMAVDIVPSAEFFTILPTSGTVAPHSRVTLDGLFRSLQLPFGDYTANVSITHDGGTGSPLNLAANLNVKNVPTVTSITSPTSQDTILQGQTVTITANATDVDSQIVKVEFFDNGVKLGESTYSSYQYSWTPTDTGTHALTARSTDVYGDSFTSAVIAVQVLPDVDQDGMDDIWEAAHGLDMAKNDAMEDLDGDRVPNIFEYYRETLPNDDTSYPAVDFVVDPATGNASPSDNVYSTIWEAVNKANEYVWNVQTQQYDRPNAWAVIEVKSGAYQGEVYLSDMPVLLLAELGSPQGPVELCLQKSSVHLYTVCALDGFVISHDNGAEGSGVYSYAPGPNNSGRALTNCIIKGNTASYGGGIHNSGYSVLRIAHCTIVGNQASYNGRAIYNSSYSKIDLVNSIIWDNTGSAPTAIYQSSTGVFADGSTSIIQGGEQGGIDENPYLNASGYLLSNSPAINRADSVLAKASKVDIHGERRDQNGTPDLGADEYRDDNGVDDGDDLPDWAELPGASGPSDDADGDGISNLAEYQAGLNPRWNDTDRDGVTDAAEINTYNSDPLSYDSDADGLSDGDEIAAGTGITTPDSDGDTVLDGKEIELGTNPLSVDTDLDGMPDGWEIAQKFGYYTLNPLVNDSALDLDKDGLSNLLEYQLGTGAGTFDSDGDGLPDGFEHNSAHLNPAVWNDSSIDFDGDGMSDLFEAIYGFNPDVADGSGDTDGDGLSDSQEIAFGSDPTSADEDGDGLNDLQEQQHGTNPWKRDSDGDTLTDGWEVQVGLNPLVYNNPAGDSDQDGLTLTQEARYNTSPSLADTDGDGTDDGTEVANNTDPTDPTWGGSPPPAPSNVVATTNSNGSITYTWQDNSNNESGFRIRQKQPDGSWTLVGSVPANTTTYTTPVP